MYICNFNALILSKPFVAVFYEFSKLLVCCVCLLIVSTPIASVQMYVMLGTWISVYVQYCILTLGFIN